MNEERVAQLNAATDQYRDQINQFLALADFLYNDLGIIGAVIPREDGDQISYTLKLIDRPSTSVQITKTFNSITGESEWIAEDLTQH